MLRLSRFVSSREIANLSFISFPVHREQIIGTWFKTDPFLSLQWLLCPMQWRVVASYYDNLGQLPAALPG